LTVCFLFGQLVGHDPRYELKVFSSAPLAARLTMGAIHALMMGRTRGTSNPRSRVTRLWRVVSRDTGTRPFDTSPDESGDTQGFGCLVFGSKRHSISPTKNQDLKKTCLMG